MSEQDGRRVMPPERWRQVEELYHAAAVREASQRGAFLKEACRGDQELQSEVESLLRQEASGDGLLGWESPPRAAPEALPRLQHGDQLGPYQVVSFIGSGGMGAVYKARDPRVGREVAIKVSAARFEGRFEREARAIAALNHSNICHLYDIGPDYLVMELVEGPTLEDRIRRGAMPLEEALGIARQVVDALDAAHSRGIVHRDLKPANLKLTPEGTVKVLDFGLAKSMALPAGDPGESPTETHEPTEAGIILGTAAYMSPEQAQSKPVDKRSDIWAFGVVLYEMLTGQRLFSGATLTETLAAVIKEEPNLDSVPESVRPLLKRCLEKDPRRRLRDIGDALATLEAPALPMESKRPVGWMVASGLAVAALGILSFVHFRERALDVGPVRFQVALPEGVRPPGALSVSPDGRKIVFVASSGGVTQLWLRSLNSLELRPLPGTSGVVPAAALLFWSPDSRFIAYRSAAKLKKVDLLGGPPETICDLNYPSLGGSWSRNGVILLGNAALGIQRVSAEGGTPSPVTVGQSAQELYPVFLEDGKHFIYLRFGLAERDGVYVGSLDAKPGEQSSKLLVRTNASPAYVPPMNGAPGRMLFLREGSLFAQDLDIGTLTLAGTPVLVAEHVGASAVLGYGFFSVSVNGVLVYQGGVPAAASGQFTWFDRHGRILGKPGEPGTYGTFHLSPDATRAAVAKLGADSPAIWIMDLIKGAERRLTFDPGANIQPVWSPDGTQVAFASYRGGYWGVYRHAANGSGSDELIAKVDRPPALTDWSHDGRYLLYQSADPKTAMDLWVLPLDGDRKPFPVVHSKANESGGYFSPDNRWIAYGSDESGQWEIYVQAFDPKGGAGTGATSGKWMVSNKGSPGMARWRQDGKELLYMASDGSIMSVPVSLNPVFRFEPSELLFRLPPKFSTAGAPGAVADVTPDHQKFLVLMPAASSARDEISVVMNWPAAIKR